MVKNPSAGRSAIRCASGWTSQKRGDRREVPDLLIGHASSPGSVEVVISQCRGSSGDHQGKVNHGTLPWAQRCRPGIAGHVAGPEAFAIRGITAGGGAGHVNLLRASGLARPVSGVRSGVSSMHDHTRG